MHNYYKSKYLGNLITNFIENIAQEIWNIRFIKEQSTVDHTYVIRQTVKNVVFDRNALV